MCGWPGDRCRRRGRVINAVIHQVKVNFNVTPEIRRFIYIYIIAGEKGCYLIDSGVAGSETIIETELKKMGRSISDVKALFITHAHPDHIGGAAALKRASGCQVYASAGEASWIENIDLQFAERPIPNFYQLVSEPVSVDCFLADYDVVILEPGLTVQSISTPGHSADELSFIMDKAAFIGDSVPVRGDIPIYVDVRELRNSLHKLSALSEIHTFYPAWDQTYSQIEMQGKIKEALEINDWIGEAVTDVWKSDKKMDSPEIARAVCEKLEMPELMGNPLFERTIESHMRLY